MRIEAEKIVVVPWNPIEIAQTQILRGQRQSIVLTPYQLQILPQFATGSSIQNFVKSSIQKSVLPLFRETYWLLEFMAREGLIMNPSFRTFFGAREIKKTTESSRLQNTAPESKLNSELKEEIKTLPFFRSLNNEGLLNLMFEKMRVRTLAKGLYICQQGKTDRSLFVLLEGQASIYKNVGSTGLGRVAVLHAGSVFGEVGFLLGEPRSAHVMTDEKCVLARIEYDSAIFDGAIKKEKAGQLQKRFWVIHALLRSGLFRSLAESSFDSLIFAGDLREHVAGEIICREGETGESCHIVIQGDFVVSKGRTVLRNLSQGESFGEIALMKTGGKRTATVQAQTDAITLEIGSERFYELLAENLIFACQFERLAETRLASDPKSSVKK